MVISESQSHQGPGDDHAAKGCRNGRKREKERMMKKMRQERTGPESIKEERKTASHGVVFSPALPVAGMWWVRRQNRDVSWRRLCRRAKDTTRPTYASGLINEI